MNQKPFFSLSALCLTLLLPSPGLVSAQSGDGAIDKSPLTFHLTAESADLLYKISWVDTNLAGHSLSLYYDTDRNRHDGILIVKDLEVQDNRDAYYWHTANLPEGSYFIYGAYNDGIQTSYHYASSAVTIKHQTTCLNLEGRTNLLPNPDFELGNDSPTSWGANTPSPNHGRSWGYQWTNEMGQARHGKRAIRISNVTNGINSNSSWEDRVVVMSPMIPLPEKNGKYVLTAWIKTDNVAAGQALLRVKYYDNNGISLKIAGHESDTFYVGGPDLVDWIRIAFMITPPHWDSPPYPDRAQAKNVRITFSLDNSPGTLWVDEVGLRQISEEEYTQYNPTNLFAAPAISAGEATPKMPVDVGWNAMVRQDQKTGIWWLVGPDSNPFWATGINLDVNEKVLAASGMSQSKYVQESRYRAGHDLSFTQGVLDTKGSGRVSSTRNYIHWLNFSSEAAIDASPEKWVLKDRAGELIAGYGHYFADVFSPIWQEHAQIEAGQLLADDAWLLTSKEVIGYWTDNEFACGDLADFFWGETAKLAFVDWLQGKNTLPNVDAVFAKSGSTINLDVPTGFAIPTPYPDIATLNMKWSSPFHTYSFRTFADILGNDKPFIRAHDDPIVKDFHAFERVIYKIYVDTVIDNIRRVEKNFRDRNGTGFMRPIFSNRFGLGQPAALTELERNMDIFSRFDVICLNLYPGFNYTASFYPRAWLERLIKTFHDTTGRPLYISEFGLAAEDADSCSTKPCLTVARWRPNTVQFQYQRGWGYATIIGTLANLPYVVGANWFNWVNGYGRPMGSDIRNSGIVDDHDSYYTNLTDTIRSVNRQLKTIHRSGNFSLDAIDWSKEKINLCPAPD